MNFQKIVEKSSNWQFKKKFKIKFFHFLQLTFTPAWGKRSGGFNLQQQQAQFNNLQNDACKTPVETLLLIYRLIQVNKFLFYLCRKVRSIGSAIRTALTSKK